MESDSVSGGNAEEREAEQFFGLNRVNPKITPFLNFISWNSISFIFTVSQLSENWAGKSHRGN